MPIFHSPCPAASLAPSEHVTAEADALRAWLAAHPEPARAHARKQNRGRRASNRRVVGGGPAPMKRQDPADSTAAPLHFEVTPADGNIFADLGLPDADELLAQAAVMNRLTRVIEERGLSDARAAEVLGTDAATVDRLFAFATRLGLDVEIGIRPAHDPAARIRVA